MLIMSARNLTSARNAEFAQRQIELQKLTEATAQAWKETAMRWKFAAEKWETVAHESDLMAAKALDDYKVCRSMLTPQQRGER